MATAPIFAPDGTLGDIPVEKLPAAIKAGAKPGVNFKSPDGSMGVIPADKIQDAYKAGGKLVPFEQQENQHPGFWQSAWNDIKGAVGNIESDPGQALQKKAAGPLYTGPSLPTDEENAQRKAQGYGPTYRALVPAAEAIGMNVKGAEQSAKEGDVAGVTGHAAVPAALAAAPLIGEAATGLAKGAGAELRDTYQAGKARQAAGQVYRDATLDPNNVPEYAGEEPGGPPANSPAALREWWKSRGGGVVDSPIDRSAMNRAKAGTAGTTPLRQPAPLPPQQFVERPQPTALGPEKPPAEVLQAKGLGATPPENVPLKQSAGLRQPVHDIVDSAIPPTGETHAANMQAKAKVEFYLQRGNVAAAENVLDTAAKGSSNWPPERPEYRGTTNDIREQQPEAIANRRADTMEDKALQQEMKWDEQRHGWQVESDARKEFIARNSTGMTKGKLIQQARIAKPGASPEGEGQAFSDLTDILQKSLEAAQKAKGAR